jgi:hypothetical protein
MRHLQVVQQVEHHHLVAMRLVMVAVVAQYALIPKLEVVQVVVEADQQALVQLLLLQLILPLVALLLIIILAVNRRSLVRLTT